MPRLQSCGYLGTIAVLLVIIIKYNSHKGEGPALKDMLEVGILDPYLVKHWGIKLATNAAITVLRVDQIIMAKPAGGPKAPQGKKDWDDDE